MEVARKRQRQRQTVDGRHPARGGGAMATAPANLQDGANPAATASSSRGRHGWMWLAMAAALLGTSGLVRAWQDNQLEERALSAETAPFPMADLPRDLGRWKAQGEDQVLDPETMEIAGASDYVARSYVDAQTGVVLSLLVVFGPAERVIGHIPEVCFPAVGYSPASTPASLTIKLDSGEARFRSMVFAKGRGLTGDRQEVYYSFRHAGHWAPTTTETRKLYRLEPATFKVQVQRRVGEAESRGQNNPIESLLSVLVPELERRIIASGIDQDRG